MRSSLLQGTLLWGLSEGTSPSAWEGLPAPYACVDKRAESVTTGLMKTFTESEPACLLGRH